MVKWLTPKELTQLESFLKKVFAQHVPDVKITISPSCEYRQIKRLDCGKYGQVYKATIPNVEGFVAVKELKPLMRSNGGVNLAVVRDLGSLSLFKHENIIRLDAICIRGLTAGKIVNPLLSIVMELCECNLVEPIGKYLIESDSERKCLMIHFLKGLSFLHSRNIMHRDLKPQNLLISSSGILKITDFGTARFKNPSTPWGPHSPLVCSPSYAPPEQHLEMSTYDESFDMWSVGCIMSELWRHRGLFLGESSIEVLKAIITICGEINNKTLPGSEQSVNYPRIWHLSNSSERDLHSEFDLSDIVEDALDLIDKLLVLTPSQRISAEQALNHRYLTSLPAPSNDLKSVLQKFRKF